MARMRNWKVDVAVDEHGDITTASAVLTTDDERVVRGSGVARRNPQDAPVADIGDEIAVGRALTELSNALLGKASEDIEAAIQPR